LGDGGNDVYRGANYSSSWIMSFYRVKGVIAAALTIVGGYLSYNSGSHTYGLYITILSSIALLVIISTFINESKWQYLSLLIIVAPLLWAIVGLVTNFTYQDPPGLAFYSTVMVLIASAGIPWAATRGLIGIREGLLARLSIIYFGLLTVWAIYIIHPNPFGP
jgi:hypothetical protein